MQQNYLERNKQSSSPSLKGLDWRMSNDRSTCILQDRKPRSTEWGNEFPVTRQGFHSLFLRKPGFVFLTILFRLILVLAFGANNQVKLRYRVLTQLDAERLLLMCSMLGQHLKCLHTLFEHWSKSQLLHFHSNSLLMHPGQQQMMVGHVIHVRDLMEFLAQSQSVWPFGMNQWMEDLFFCLYHSTFSNL